MFRIMNTKMTIILISILFFSLIECQDWCSVIRPNQKYEGLGITRHWNSVEENDVKFVMYNKAGKEWFFKWTYEEGYKPKDMTIRLVKNSVKDGPNGTVLNRFAMYFNGLGVIGPNVPYAVNCQILDMVCIL